MSENLSWWELPGAAGEVRTKEMHDEMVRQAKEPAPRKSKRWRYEIQYGPEGEEAFAWVYDGDGVLVCTARVYHAFKIVGSINSEVLLEAADVLRGL